MDEVFLQLEQGGKVNADSRTDHFQAQEHNRYLKTASRRKESNILHDELTCNEATSGSTTADLRSISDCRSECTVQRQSAKGDLLHEQTSTGPYGPRHSACHHLPKECRGSHPKKVLEK